MSWSISTDEVKGIDFPEAVAKLSIPDLAVKDGITAVQFEVKKAMLVALFTSEADNDTPTTMYQGSISGHVWDYDGFHTENVNIEAFHGAQAGVNLTRKDHKAG